MAGDTTGDRAITVRCSSELRLMVKWTASANDQNMSEYVRETLREAAVEELGEDVVEEAKRQVADEANDSS